jgi:Flp pilus assembly protein TadG
MVSKPVRATNPQASTLDGQGLVEFALAIPLFLLLLFGLIDIGRLVYVNNALAEGAREGARWGSVQSRSNAPSTIQMYTLGIMAAVPNATVTITCQNASGTSVTTCGSNHTLTVAVSSQVTMFTPVISNIVGTLTLTATSKVKVNQ